MKKRTKRTLLTLLIVSISLVIIISYTCKKFDLLTSSEISSNLKSANDNVITFDVKSFHDYVNIMLDSKKNKNIKDGLEFDIINPDGEVIENGTLYEDKVIRQSYKKKDGEWKVVLHYKNNDASSIIGFGYAINSTKKNGMRIESE